MPRTSKPEGQLLTTQPRASKLAPSRTTSRRTRSCSRASSVLNDSDATIDSSIQGSNTFTPCPDEALRDQSVIATKIEEESEDSDRSSVVKVGKTKIISLRVAPPTKDQFSAVSAFEAVNELCKRTREAEDKLTELQRENEGLLEELKASRRREQNIAVKLREEKKRAQDQHSRFSDDVQKRTQGLEDQISRIREFLQTFGTSAEKLLPLLNMLASDGFRNEEDIIKMLSKQAETDRD